MPDGLASFRLWSFEPKELSWSETETHIGTHQKCGDTTLLDRHRLCAHVVLSWRGDSEGRLHTNESTPGPHLA